MRILKKYCAQSQDFFHYFEGPQQKYFVYALKYDCLFLQTLSSAKNKFKKIKINRKNQLD